MNPTANLRSRPSILHSYLVLINFTQRTVDVIWVDYKSNFIRYTALPPGGITPLNTFSTHPWVFRDHVTGEHMHVNNAAVFWPSPWLNNQTTRARVQIHLPMRPLRTISMWAILENIKSVSDIDRLELPATLSKELVNIFKNSNP